MSNHWPELIYENGKETYKTLHMLTQVVGKIKLAVNPWLNHSWHITLHITPSGLSTLDMSDGIKNFQIDFDFLTHKLKVITSDGESCNFDLRNLSVAGFYHKIFEVLTDLQIYVKINTVPSEISDPIPFQNDTLNSTYIETEVKALFLALLRMKKVFTQYRCDFKGKCSPVHFFWGAFDLAVSRFSGRKAPKHPGGIPNLPDWVAQEAYSHEVASCGFWPGSEVLPEPVFYAYIYPEPAEYNNAIVQPEEAYYHATLREFILPYKIVQQSVNPEEILSTFLNSTYKAAAELAKWNRSDLEV
jgi:hypothetical protein